MTPASAGIAYLDGPRLGRSLVAAADWVDSRREELNRINVFPVPDGDTGTNFAVTLRAGAEAVRHAPQRSLHAVAGAAAEACVYAARGNSGLLLSQFLLGFRDGIAGQREVEAVGLARAVRGGADQLTAALDEPVEGTILTVCRDVAAAAEQAASRTSRLDQMISGMLDQAQASLRRTPELLAALQQAGVVDAGAKAFVLTLEGVMRLIEGRPIEPPTREAAPAAAAATAMVAAERDFGFCTEILVRGDHLPAPATARAALRPLGGSIVALNTGTALKIHIHTDTPERVFELGRRWGTLEATKAEDVRAQHRALAAERRALSIVVDSSSDLTDRELERGEIEMVPIQVIQGDRTWLDRVDLQPREVYRLMQQEGAEPLTTSQPAPGAFARALADAKQSGESVLCLTIAAALSGTFASAQAAARSVGPGVTVLDSRSASLGMGLLALRARDLARAGWPLDRIVAELNRVRDRSSGFFTVDRFDQLLRSGRVGKGKAWLGTVLGIRPILEIVSPGRVVPVARAFGARGPRRAILALLERRLHPRPRRLRLGVVHADAEGPAQEIRSELERRFQPVECLVGPVATAIGVHVGPGALGVFYQVEEPAAADPDPAPRN